MYKSNGDQGRWLRSVLLGLLGLGLFAFANRVGVGGAPQPALATTLIVVAAHSMSEGATVADRDVATVSTPDAPALHSLVHRTTDVLGRRLRVPLAEGTPLTAMMVDDSLGTSHAIVNVVLDHRYLPADMRSGDTVDVVALRDPHEAADTSVIGTAGLIDIRHDTSTDRSGGALEDTIATLDCDEPTALAIMSAQSTSSVVRLLRHIHGTP